MSIKSPKIMITNNRPINLKVIRCELNFLPPKNEADEKEERPKRNLRVPQVNFRRKSVVPAPPSIKGKTPNVNELVDSLLEELYSDWSNSSDKYGTSCAQSFGSSQSTCEEHSNYMEMHYLEDLDIDELLQQEYELRTKLTLIGERLGRCVRAKDRYRRQQKRLCATFTVILRHISDDAARFSVTPGSGDGSGEGGYSEWLHAMRLVARLPAGVPHHFRKKLWLTLAERYLNSRGVDWPAAERACFRGSAQPDDAELGAQILKDLHRTGCSLFCGKEGRENQGMLRRVLLAYARWNKDVGYCQGFNMLAAIILEVMDKSESDSLKVMVYLVEAVLPEGYFADDLRGLSADMAAFRDLLRLRLPRLATHMDYLQKMSDGGGVEPPLPDVFTMQWFLTLYATWLPRESLLRIWDLILLDGNEVLLLTALAIWDMLQDRILSARSADEYYSCMGGGAGAIWEAGDALVARVVAFGTAPELPRLRNLHRYRVTPPATQPAPSQPPFYHPPLHSAMQTMTKKGLRLFYSEDEGDSSDDGNKMALATVIPRRDDRMGAGDRLTLDIGALKRQYARLRERQRQAHVILAAACARHAAVGVPTSPTSLTVNNLLLGKSAIVSSRGRRLGPPPGAIPPSRQCDQKDNEDSKPHGEQTSDTISWIEEKNKKTLSRRNSLKWKDIKREKIPKKGRKASIDFDERGDGIIVSESEANEMIASLRSRSSSDSSSYSSHSGSSTDTSLCDEGGSDSETDIVPDVDKHKKSQSIKKEFSPRKKSRTVEEKSSQPAKVSSSAKSYIKSTDEESHRSYICGFQNNETINEDGVIDTYHFESKPFIDKIEPEISKERNYLYNPSNVQDETLPSPSRFYSTSRDKTSPLVYDESDKDLEVPDTNVHKRHQITKEKLSSITKPNTVVETSSPPAKVTSPASSDINKYIKSTAGESLRSYISEFQNNVKMNEDGVIDTYYFGSKPYPDDPEPINDIEKNYFYNPSYIQSEEVPSPPRFFSPVKENTSTVSPLRLYSPPNIACSFENNPLKPWLIEKKSPDIIDSLAKFPNFVPDIDLSDKNTSDFDSPLRSPDAESIVVSEDEPPIPLKIDKYFEHSPEFFGARITATDSNNPNIPTRRAAKRLLKAPRKPDSLTLQTSHNKDLLDVDKEERASSLPQSYSEYENNNNKEKRELHEKVITLNNETAVKNLTMRDLVKENLFQDITQEEMETVNLQVLNKMRQSEIVSPKSVTSRLGRKNSDRALQIIQENSKILSRILTKQNIPETIENVAEKKTLFQLNEEARCATDKRFETSLPESTYLKESTSDSLIGYNRQSNTDLSDKNRFLRNRPISIDDPSSFDINKVKHKNNEFLSKVNKSPSTDSLLNKTDHYGWENKGFLVKHEYTDRKIDDTNLQLELLGGGDPSNIIVTTDAMQATAPMASKTPITSPSLENKDKSIYEKFSSHGYSYPLSTRYNDFVLTRASDICSKTAGLVPKVCENLSKTDNSQVSDFAHVVTSSISFTYDPSAEDDSPIGAKSNSSDTLCQITSLDQVSTPISPKIFPRETPTNPKEFTDKSDRVRLESDDTCSAITSLLETDTISSLSCPRSPTTGSYHFPSRPPIRMPKELGVRLGMYPKDSIQSPPK